MNTITDFLSYLSSLDIKLWAEGDRLRCNAPKDALTPEIKAELATRKSEILAFFRQENSAIQGNSQRIQPMPRSQTIPLSFAQQRLWFFTQLEPDSFAYHLPIAVKLQGQLNIDCLSKSLTEIVQRHEGLRTNFTVVNEEPVQVIGNGDKFALSVINLQDIAEADQHQTILNFTTSESQKPFDLTQDSLIRATLLQVSETNFILLLTLHHIVADGWSMGIFIKELTSLYCAFLNNQPSFLPSLPIQYADFAIWQRQWLQRNVLETQLNYWKQKLKGNLPILELPFDRPRPTIQSHHGATKTFTLSPDLAEQLKAFSQQQGVTLFMTLLAAFKVLLYRYTQQQDLLVGTPIANRNRSEIEGLIGCFVNTLVLRTNLSGTSTFKELLQQVREVTLEAYAHQELPFERLVEELHPGRNLSHNPLFSVMFILQNTPTEPLKLPDLTLEILTTKKDTANFDLTLSIVENQIGLVAEFEYNTDLFNSDRISRMAEHFQVLLVGILANSDQRLSNLPLLTAQEKHQLFSEWNATQINFPENLCIHQLFEAQVERTPDAVAVVFGNEQLTYQQLNLKANQLAHFLQQQGVKPETLVGVCCWRSLEMLVALLGILKAGGAYVPLDPSYPPERLAFMVEDARLSVIITQTPFLQAPLDFNAIALPHLAPKVICLDALGDQLTQQKTENSDSGITANNLAYVIYTSGSTGKPKGVQITHQAVVNFLTSMGREPGLTAEDTLVAVTTISFDIAVLELYLPLMVGSRIALASREIARDAQALIELLNSSSATVMQATPSTWRMLLDAGWAGNKQLKALCGGESLSQELAYSLLEKTGSLWNLYGPTEATVWATCGQIKAEERISIGKPIANTQVYILDQQLQPVPVGIPGELHIGGAGLARGYLNRPELTGEKFLSRMRTDGTDDTDWVDGLTFESGRLRMLTDDTDDGDVVGVGFPRPTRLYKTGDLGRYLADGQIEYLGRLDHQVKLRGFRIELGEIEAVLEQHPGVRQGVVMVREDVPGNPRLVAYLVAEATVQEELRWRSRRLTASHLQQKLPEYMIPNAFVILDAFPLTPNGKIDRRALPAPDLTHTKVEPNYTSPRTPIEDAIAHIWTQILGLETVGIEQNFFELGGHSLLATQLISRLRQIFQIDLPLQKIFEFPTIAGLATVIETIKQTQDELVRSPILPISRKEPLPLSFAQQRLWFLEQLQPNHAAYNITQAVQVSGSLNITALEASLNEIIKRHEALRTTFIEVQGLPMQVITENLQLSIPILDLQLLSKSEQEQKVQQIITQEIKQPFNLKQLPLLRVVLLKLNPTEFVIIFTLHHIISDAWSMAILIKEFIVLYPALAEGKMVQLPKLPIQYGDFAVWQRQWLQGQVLQTQLTYWKQKLGTNLPVLKLPYIPNQTTSPIDQAGIQTFTLSAELSHALKTLSRQENATLFMTMVAALNTLFYRATGQDDIVIGTDVANRNHGETEGLIGFFVNLLVLRTDLSGYPNFRELLQRVKTLTLEAYSHQDLPFEKLVEELQPERHLSHSPLFQVLFVMDNVPTQNLELPGLQLTPIETKSQTAKFDLTLFMWESPSGIQGSWSYKVKLFEPEKLTLMFENFVTLLQSIVTQPDARINSLDILTQTQKHDQQEQTKLKKLMQIKPKTIKL